jgi:hypothetical protein
MVSDYWAVGAGILRLYSFRINERMKSLYTTTCLLLLVLSALGQHRFSPAPGSYVLDPHAFAVEGGNRDVIWSEDFSDGFDSGWTSFGLGGVADWEYRGPNTTPNIEVGSRGSCVVGNLGEPILSPTAANGFMIFDSNWWDNPDLPCSEDNFGTGPAPGPHFATLTSPSIDLSAYGSVALKFNQYCKRLTGDTYVEVSIDGGFNWFPVFSNPDLPNPTLPYDEQVIQISTYVAYQPNVRIRFVFNAMYYYWQIDDVELIDTYSNDLAIAGINYGDFDLYDLSHPTGYEFMEYSKYPTSMPPDLKFSAMAENLGGIFQSDCRLHVDVFSQASGSVVHQASSTEGFFINTGEALELRAGNYQVEPVLGEFKLAYRVDQQEIDEDELNNVDTAIFYMNDVQYARDALFASAVYLGTPEQADLEYELGNVFHITAEDLTCHSITVAVGIGSSTPAQIEGRLYRFDISTGVEADLLATSQPIDITASMLNGYGEQILTNLVFDSPVQLYAGEAYYVAVASDDGVDNFVCAMAGVAEEATALVRYFPNDWYYLDMLPMIRMNFGPFNSINERTDIVRELHVYPNPSSHEVLFELPVHMLGKVEARWYDSMGRMVKTDAPTEHSSLQYRASVAELPSGMYHVILNWDGILYKATVHRI